MGPSYNLLRFLLSSFSPSTKPIRTSPAADHIIRQHPRGGCFVFWVVVERHAPAGQTAIAGDIMCQAEDDTASSAGFGPLEESTDMAVEAEDEAERLAGDEFAVVVMAV